MTMGTYHSCKNELDPDCGRLCSHDNLTHLMTRIAIVEGTVLERLEDRKTMSLRKLMEELPWEPCAITMAVGSLARQGMIRCGEDGIEVFLELTPL